MWKEVILEIARLAILGKVDPVAAIIDTLENIGGTVTPQAVRDTLDELHKQEDKEIDRLMDEVERIKEYRRQRREKNDW